MSTTCRFLLLLNGTFLALAGLAAGRAVNISNTWMLPEEGFPVFYRHFRDRISWYEADAVCQFHHANLVTADSTLQYDAIRAYLKELDITENVWIGLSKTAEKPNFTWTDFNSLSTEGHWQEPIPTGNNPLCVTMDPAADFLWKAMACGGPEAASFICELPVPSWAMGPKGCLLTELPSLTVLYIPEQLALELTSDCGLDGTKRIACKGNANREEILKQLTCDAISPDDFDDKSTKIPTAQPIQTTAAATVTGQSQSEDVASSTAPLTNGKTTKPWIWTSNTIEYGMPTRHRRETENTEAPLTSTKSSMDLASTHQSVFNKTDGDSSVTTSASILAASLKPNIAYSSGKSAAITTSTTTSAAPSSSTTAAAASKSYPATATTYITTKAGKSDELKTTRVVADSTTQDSQSSHTQTEEVETAAVTDQAKAASSTSTLSNEETGAAAAAAGEYPSAIGQGQLFSIIENGTMFDIIELNETTESDGDGRLAKDIIGEKPQTANEVLKASTANAPSTTNTDNMYTTVVYHKEPPSSVDSAFVTNKSPKKAVEFPKKLLSKNKNVKKSSAILPPKENASDKSLNDKQNFAEDNNKKNRLTKEVELFPFTADSLVRLNRTFRKQLPANEQAAAIQDDAEDTLAGDTQFKIVNFPTNNHLNEPFAKNGDNNQHIEIKLNETEKTIFLTSSSAFKRVQNPLLIDPRIDDLNNSTQTAETESEILKPERIIKASNNNNNADEQSQTEDAINSAASSANPLEPEPQAQPRPNRQRQLTRPQRRSFYPYFFSRVLG